MPLDVSRDGGWASSSSSSFVTRAASAGVAACAETLVDAIARGSVRGARGLAGGSAATRGRRLRRDARQRGSVGASRLSIRSRTARFAAPTGTPNGRRDRVVTRVIALPPTPRPRRKRATQLRRGGSDVGPVAQRRSREMPGTRSLLRARDERDGRVLRPPSRVRAVGRPRRHLRAVPATSAGEDFPGARAASVNAPSRLGRLV